MKAVFDINPDKGYNPSDCDYRYPASKHDFHNIATAAVGDMILFRETASGKNGYVAVSELIKVEPDPQNLEHFIAHLSEPNEFKHVVPFVTVDPPQVFERPLEKHLRKENPAKAVGAAVFSKSIRELDELDFANILRVGQPTHLNIRKITENIQLLKAAEQSESSLRRKILHNQNRLVRDASFRKIVMEAYKYTCAVTGFKIIDDNYNTETEAAHIKPVADDGPDIVQNGIALSSTCHWLFDRHLISIQDDYTLLVKEDMVPEELNRIFNAGGKINLPKDKKLWPLLEYIQLHREKFVSGR